jgi:undecaprenyl-diphosphatase
MGGLTLGLVWVALLGIAYRRHPASTLPLSGLLLISMLTTALAYGWQSYRNFDNDVQRYARKVEYVTIAESEWWLSGWRTLPSHRNDLRGWKSQPLSIQYAGDLQVLESMLTRRGWKQPVKIDAFNWLQWLDESIPPQRQPLLPQLHDGRTEAMLLISQDYLAPRLLTLRLWDSGIRLQPNNVPLWTGSVAYLAVPADVSLHVPRVQPNFDEAFRDFAPEASSLPHRISPADEQRSATLLMQGLFLE